MEMVHGIMDQAEELGYSLTICKYCLNLKNMPVAIKRQHLDGLIIHGWETQKIISTFSKLDLPMVLLDCDQWIPSFPQIQIGNINALEALVKHLIEQGATKFATITGDLEHINARERLAGLQSSLFHNNNMLSTENIIIEKNFDVDSGYRGVETLLQRGVEFDALVCQNDLIAYGALTALRQAGRRVPEDVLLTGFDNMPISKGPDISLTTVDTMPYILGMRGCELFKDHLETENGKKNDVKIISSTKLILRESTKCCVDRQIIKGD